MSKLWFDKEISVSKSNCLLDGLYRNTFHDMIYILRVSGNSKSKPSVDFSHFIFTYKLVNKTSEAIENVNFKLRKYKGEIKLVSTNENFRVPEQGLAEGTLFIEIDKSQLTGDKNKLIIEVYSEDELIETTTVNFLGPRSYN